MLSANVETRKMAKRQLRISSFFNQNALVSGHSEADKQTETNTDCASLSLDLAQDENPPDSDQESRPASHKKPRRDRVFQKDWLVKFPWLKFDSKVMTCLTCMQSNLKLSNPFSSDTGCINFRTSTLLRHEGSADHRRAVSCLKQKEYMSVAVSKAIGNKEEAVVKLMRTVYYIAKSELSISKYPSLLELMELNGVDINPLGEGYRSRKTADGLLEAMSAAIDLKVAQKIEDSEFLSMMCDETTDIATLGKIIIFTKVISENLEVETYFIGDYDITDKTANGITEKLREASDNAGIEMEKCMALGTDGASTMMGKKNGVGVQLQRLNPYMLQFHCSAHKLALCTEQAAAKVG